MTVYIYLSMEALNVVFGQNTGCQNAPPKTSSHNASVLVLNFGLDTVAFGWSVTMTSHDYAQLLLGVTWVSKQWIVPDLGHGPTFCSYIVGANSPSFNCYLYYYGISFCHFTQFSKTAEMDYHCVQRIDKWNVLELQFHKSCQCQSPLKS